MADMKTVTINGVTYKVEDPDALSGTDTTLSKANKAADAAAVGAALAGKASAAFGLGDVAKPLVGTGADLNSITQNGWYRFESAYNAHAPFSKGVLLVLAYSALYGHQVAFQADVYDTRIAVRKCTDGTWGEWEDVSSSAFAPANYASRTYECNSDADVDAAILDIYASISDRGIRYCTITVNATGLALKTGIWHCKVNRATAKYGSIEATSYGSYGPRRMLRNYYESTLGEWEWIDPLMEPGVEYRTTERYMGKVVYAKLINFGYLPNTGSKTVTIAGDGIAYPVRASLLLGGSASTQGTAIGDGYPYIKDFYTQSNQIVITTNADVSSTNARVEIRYTKS